MFNPLPVETCSQRTLKSKLQHSKPDVVFFILVQKARSSSVALMQVAEYWLKFMKGSWWTLLFGEFLCILHQWNPLSSSSLLHDSVECEREVGKWWTIHAGPTLVRLTMWGLCGLVDQQTQRPFSWVQCFPNPTPAFLLQSNYTASTCRFMCLIMPL